MLLRSTLGLATLLSVPPALVAGPGMAGAAPATRPVVGAGIGPAAARAPRVMVVRSFAFTPATAKPGRFAATDDAAPRLTASGPAVDIKGPPANFQPGSVSAPEIASGSTCSATNYSFMLANTTHVTRTLILGGHQVVALSPKQSTVFCAADTGGGSFTLTFHLSGHAQARLVATFSPTAPAP